MKINSLKVNSGYCFRFVYLVSAVIYLEMFSFVYFMFCIKYDMVFLIKGTKFETFKIISESLKGRKYIVSN